MAYASLKCGGYCEFRCWKIELKPVLDNSSNPSPFFKSFRNMLSNWSEIILGVPEIASQSLRSKNWSFEFKYSLSRFSCVRSAVKFLIVLSRSSIASLYDSFSSWILWINRSKFLIIASFSPSCLSLMLFSLSSLAFFSLLLLLSAITCWYFLICDVRNEKFYRMLLSFN